MFDDELVKRIIRTIPDYPKKGIQFRDITTLLKDSIAFSMCIDELARRASGRDIDYIVGIEARGFIIGAALAYKMDKGFIPVRKKGKLPHDTVTRDYDLEYGSASIEIHRDAIKKGESVLIADDLLATGGTARAVAELVSELGGKVSAMAFLVELKDLKGREVLNGNEVISLIEY